MSVNKEKKNYRNICVTCISSPANRAKITYEMYNLIMDVLLHSLSVHEFKNYPKRKKKKCQYWDLKECSLFPKSTAITR